MYWGTCLRLSHVGILPIPPTEASYVSAFVTHAVFPKQSWKNCQEVFHKFWVTDSCPTTVSELQGQAPFEVVSLVSALAKTLEEQDFLRRE